MSLYSEHAERVNRIQRDIARAESDRIRRKGDLVGGTLAMLGRVPLEIMADRDRQRAAEQQAAQQAEKDAFARRKGEAEIADIEGRGADRAAGVAAKEEEAKLKTAAQLLGVANEQNWKAIRTSVGASIPWLAQSLPDTLPPPEAIQNYQRVLVGDLGKAPEAPKAPSLITGVDEQGNPIRVEDKPGAPVYQQPKGLTSPPNPTEWSVAMQAAGGDAVKAMELVRRQRAGQGGADGEPLQAIMGDDGQPILVPRSQAAGKRPASNREQGRNVTSGDVSRITDLDASLSDLAVLEQTIAGVADATGTSAQIGAALPNFVTNATGIGTEAKQKQAVIDRVKQVIGKALEGGVLRKEDEIKYGKILPTIGDPPAVVKSKLAGLKQAIDARREQFLSNLEDANYDVSRYRNRAPAAETADPLGIR